MKAALGKSTGRRPTRGLTEGAILAALSAVAAGLGLVVPLIGVMFAPIPVMLLVIRWGLRTAALAAIVAGLILLQFFGPLNALLVTVTFAPAGLALGWGAQRGIGGPLTVLAGAAAFLVSSVAAVGLTILVLHQDVLGQFIQTQVQGIQMAVSLGERFGSPPQQLEEWRALVNPICAEHHCYPAAFPQLIRTVLPVLLTLTALTSAYLCYTLARSVIRRVGHEIPAVPPILTWRVSPPLASGLLYAYAGLSVANLWFPVLTGAVWNAMILIVFVFGFQGTLVGITWMNKRQIPRLAQILAVLLVLTSGLLPELVLAMVGILDTWYDYRHLAPPRARGAATAPEAQPPPSAKVVHPQ